jgi:hypothetical protein
MFSFVHVIASVIRVVGAPLDVVHDVTVTAAFVRSVAPR